MDQLEVVNKQLVNRGWYVPDDLTNLIVKNKILDLETNHQHFILDGYPRTLEQAHNFSINWIYLIALL